MSNQKSVIYANADKCRGCRKCELACIASHNNMTVKEAVKVRNEFEPRVHVNKTDTIKMPVQCRQCDDAPCARVCPTQALVQNISGDIVMRTEHCAGCGLCVMVCPYGRSAGLSCESSRKKRPALNATSRDWWPCAATSAGNGGRKRAKR